MRTFGEFLSKRDRDNREHLRILGHILEKAEFKVKPHLDNKEPYLYIAKPDIDRMDDIQFGGVRVYCRGKDIICFRSQMDPEAEPFGESYHLDISGMYKDLAMDEAKKTPYLIIYHVIQELRDFFVQCAEAETKADQAKNEPMGSIVVGGTGSDYSNFTSDVKRS